MLAQHHSGGRGIIIITIFCFPWMVREGAGPPQVEGKCYGVVRGNVLSNYPRRIALGTAAATAAVLTSTNISGPGSTAKRRPVFVALWVRRKRVYMYMIYVYTGSCHVTLPCPLLLLLHPPLTVVQ